MITISGTLEAAAVAECRSPIARVQVQPGGLNITEISGISIPGKYLYCFVPSFTAYVATAINADHDTLYSNSITDPTSAADWNATWDTVASGLAGWGSHAHDLVQSGGTFVCAYSDGTDIKYKQGAPGAWGAELTAASMSGHDVTSIKYITMPSIYRMYAVCRKTGAGYRSVMFSLTRPDTGNTWVVEGEWTHGDALIIHPSGISLKPHARYITPSYPNASAQDRILMNARIGANDDQSIYMFRVTDDTYGSLEPAMGTLPVDSDYGIRFGGLSQELGGLYYAGIIEKYRSRADENTGTTQFVLGCLYLGITRDMKSFYTIPLFTSWNTVTEGSQYNAFICGAATYSDYLIVVVGKGTGEAILQIDKNELLGLTAPETDISSDVVESITINRNMNTAATAAFTLSNADGAYNDHAIAKEGGLAVIDAGYNTGAGDEYQQRFIGRIMKRQQPDCISKGVSFTALDFLSHATARKQPRAHWLTGPNMMHLDFENVEDGDQLISHYGKQELEVVNGHLTISDNDHMNNTTVAHEPGDQRVIIAKVRGREYWNGTALGLTLSMNEGGERAIIVYWRYDRLAIGYHRLDMMGDIDYYVRTDAIYTWSVDTWYWLKVFYQNGCVIVFYSLDGITWYQAINWTNVSITNGSIWAPPRARTTGGIFCQKVNDTGVIEYDEWMMHGLEKPQTGSDVMRYMAGLCGMGTAEEHKLNDDFPGTSFSSRWNTTTKLGTWTVSGSMAQGSIGSGVAVLMSDVSGTDLVAMCDVSNLAGAGGIALRCSSDLTQCYIGIVNDTLAQIRKRKSGAWTTLCSIPHNVGTLGDNGQELKFMARGPWLSLYINDMLVAVAYDDDEDMTSGFCGLAVQNVTPQNIDWFTIDAFPIPVDVVLIRPNDTLASIMAQIVGMYEGGGYFCNYEGKLVWGVFTDTTVDLDVRAVQVDTVLSKDVSPILTHVRIDGANAYGDARDPAWAQELGGNIFNFVQDKSLISGAAAYDAAADVIQDSQRISSESVGVPGQPQLELGDTIGIGVLSSDGVLASLAEKGALQRGAGAATPANLAEKGAMQRGVGGVGTGYITGRVLDAFSETVSPGTYLMTFSSLKSPEAETP